MFKEKIYIFQPALPSILARINTKYIYHFLAPSLSVPPLHFLPSFFRVLKLCHNHWLGKLF